MKAVLVHAEGEFPRCESIPEPRVPARGELRIKVAAAGLNYADTLVRRGLYLQKPRFPHVLGLEYAGTIEAVGPETPGWRVGQLVMGLAPHAFAASIIVEARGALPVPERFSVEEAAAFPLAFVTAYAMLRLTARAVRGETVLIHAAGGGVGTAAVQLSKHLGLRVIACASRDDKLERVRKLGADHTVNYSRDDFVPPAREFTGGRGVEIALESVGGDFLARTIEAMAPFGRVVIIGAAGGGADPLEPAALYPHSVSVSAFWLITLAGQPALFGKIAQELMAIVQTTEIRPIMGGTYSFEEATAAIRALESRATCGKLVLRP